MHSCCTSLGDQLAGAGGGPHDFHMRAAAADRKSTRLNSSHLVISYAVFCLKKKNSQHRASQALAHFEKQAAIHRVRLRFIHVVLVNERIDSLAKWFLRVVTFVTRTDLSGEP